MTWNKAIALSVEANTKVEPLLSVDSVSRWSYVRFIDLVAGDALPITVQFRELSGGLTTVVSPLETDTLSLTIRKHGVSGPTGEILAFIEAFTVGAISSGTLDLNTTNMAEAIGAYKAISVVYEMTLKTSSGSVKASWQWGGDIRRRVFDGPPPTITGGPSYLTEAETEAKFSRRDGPEGYGMKMVEHEGLLYWAQLVNDVWVIPKIMNVGGYNTISFVEAS